LVFTPAHNTERGAGVVEGNVEVWLEDFVQPLDKLQLRLMLSNKAVEDHRKMKGWVELT
jgi:hypothetical protein